MSSPDAERARLERLIAAADRVATQPIPPTPRRMRGATMAALAVVGVGALGLGLKMCTSDETLPDALDDNEKDRLRHLMRRVSHERSGTPLGITHRAAQAVTAEMWVDLDALEAWRTMDVAAYCGVQVHVQDHEDLIAVTDAQFVGADGVRTSLPT